LFVFIVLQHQRRRIVHFGVTVSPISQWTLRQIREALPWESAPRYLIRDRDASHGVAFRSRTKAMDITEVLSAPRSPWQNASAERVIGSIRRDCLNHDIVLSEHHLRRLCLPTWGIITTPEPTSPSKRIAQSRAWYSRRIEVGSSPFRRSADSTVL
jgi:hypothetical protein